MSVISCKQDELAASVQAYWCNRDPSPAGPCTHLTSAFIKQENLLEQEKMDSVVVSRSEVPENSPEEDPSHYSFSGCFKAWSLELWRRAYHMELAIFPWGAKPIGVRLLAKCVEGESNRRGEGEEG